MLSFTARGPAFCDGRTRRDFLKIGALAVGGLTLPQLLRAESAGRSTGMSIINIYLPGGPTHLDTFDLKPNAPKEFRGEFLPIATSAPGLDICELMPQLARHGNDFSVIRSVAGMRNEHAPTQSDSGWSQQSLRSIGGRPGLGAVMSKLHGPSCVTELGASPTFVDLTGWTNEGFLGQMHAGFRPTGDGMRNLSLQRGLTAERLSERTSLLEKFDRLRHEVDSSGSMSAMDSFTERALGIVTSGDLARALDLKQESAETLETYGASNRRNRFASQNERFILSRRLIQAGARCVAFAWGSWDTHGQNFRTMRDQLPALDVALSALIDDLKRHDLFDRTIIMMSGEFGRTPRINGGAGRDHWPQAAFFFLAGGGFRHGQAIGATTRNGETPAERPIPLQHIFHTVYHQLGIDANAVTLPDPNGRPQFLVDERELITELL